MSALPSIGRAVVVHHHHYYAQVPPATSLHRSPSPRSPALARRSSTSPAVYLGAGAAIAVALVVATAVAAALAVVGGLVLLLVLAGRHYAQIERDHRVMARPPVRRDARGRFTA